MTSRPGQFLADLSILLRTVATLVRLKAWRRPAETYPLRCQHCTRSIRLATTEHPTARAHGIAVYRDAAGHYSCDGTIRMRHQPMPSPYGRTDNAR